MLRRSVRDSKLEQSFIVLVHYSVLLFLGKYELRFYRRGRRGRFKSLMGMKNF